MKIALSEGKNNCSNASSNHSLVVKGGKQMCEEGTVRKKEQVEQIPVDSLGKADKCQVATNNRKAV